MSFRFNPPPRNEIKIDFDPWPEGKYEFSIIEAKNQISKTNKNMIKLEIDIHNKEYKTRKLFHYIVIDESSKETFNRSMGNLAKFCDSIKCSEMFDKGNIDIELLSGKTGECFVKIVEDNYSETPKKINKLSYFIVGDKTSSNDENDETYYNEPINLKNEQDDDDLPF